MRFGLLLLLVVSMHASADAYKCKGSNGKVVITATPCDVGYSSARVAKSDGTDTDSYYQAQADLERQKAWLVGRDRVNQEGAAIARQQAAAIDRANPQQVQQVQRSDSLWDKSWGCGSRSCPSTRTTIR